MSIQSLVNRPCSITRRLPSLTTDDYGNEIPDEEIIQTVCEIQSRSTQGIDEPQGMGEVSDTEWTIFLLPDESLHTADTVTVDGESYEIVGEPWRARNPRTRIVEHIEATARRVAGAHDEVGS